MHAGVIAKLHEQAPHILGMHGCARRLELAVKDACKLNKLVSDLDDVLEHVWMMYTFFTSLLARFASGWWSDEVAESTQTLSN